MLLHLAFYERHQRPGESSTDIVAALQQLALHCSFNNLDEVLLNRLVCGLQNKKLQG